MFAVGLISAVGLGGGIATAEDVTSGLPKCPVMDEPVSFAVSVAADDGPVFFCCDACIPKYKKDPAKYAAKVAAQRKALAGRPKVQVTCPVSGEPVDRKAFIEKNGEKVYFCCKDCISKFQKEPDRYKVALANSYTYQTKCPVMGGDIDPQSFTTLAGGQKIYFCCPACEKKLFDDPAKYGPKLEAQGFKIKPDQIKPAKKGEAGEHHDAHEHDHGGHDHGD